VKPTKSALHEGCRPSAGSDAELVGGALAAGGRACQGPPGQIPPPWSRRENEAPTARAACSSSQAQPVSSARRARPVDPLRPPPGCDRRRKRRQRVGRSAVCAESLPALCPVGSLPSRCRHARQRRSPPCPPSGQTLHPGRGGRTRLPPRGPLQALATPAVAKGRRERGSRGIRSPGHRAGELRMPHAFAPAPGRVRARRPPGPRSSRGARHR
jgi:hypothetical protein